MRERNTSSGWTTWEVVLQDSEGEWSVRPVSDVIAESGNEAIGALNKTTMVEEIGWPDAQRLQFTSGTELKARVVAKSEGLWLLKCNPNPWRLFFYVSQNQNRPEPNRFVYVHAAYKRKIDEDPAEERIAVGVKRELFNGGGARIQIAPFAFPPR